VAYGEDRDKKRKRFETQKMHHIEGYKAELRTISKMLKEAGERCGHDKLDSHFRDSANAGFWKEIHEHVKEGHKQLDRFEALIKKQREWEVLGAIPLVRPWTVFDKAE
jgi:ATP/maltotriose-dependent transcriptional regulator MalT